MMELYLSDPLDTDVPAPMKLLNLWVQEHCECPEYAEHLSTCRMLPTMHDTFKATGVWPYHVQTNKLWWDRRWACVSEDIIGDQSIYPHHVGGTINGPVHFCPFQHRIVGPDE